MPFHNVESHLVLKEPLRPFADRLRAGTLPKKTRHVGGPISRFHFGNVETSTPCIPGNRLDIQGGQELAQHAGGQDEGLMAGVQHFMPLITRLADRVKRPADVGDLESGGDGATFLCDQIHISSTVVLDGPTACGDEVPCQFFRRSAP